MKFKSKIDYILCILSILVICSSASFASDNGTDELSNINEINNVYLNSQELNDNI